MLFCRNFISSSLFSGNFFIRSVFGVEEMKSFPIFVFVLIQLDEGEELCTHSREEKTLLVDDDDDFERQIISIVGMLDGDSKNGTSILCFYVRFVDFIREEKFNARRSFVCSFFLHLDCLRSFESQMMIFRPIQPPRCSQIAMSPEKRSNRLSSKNELLGTNFGSYNF